MLFFKGIIMFKLIKWVIIIFVIGSGYYVVNFFLAMDKDSLRKVKYDAVEAIDSGDMNTLLGPLSEQIKKDLSHKKSSFVEKVKQKLKDTINFLID
jgi:hypothetical protein